ncbi:deoxyribose-phosphate aldolase [Neolewinella antarctica]|uniref:Deoxyribose-phosphate aldolase n=1 Tax=Neolewinella antarctica TaxID=442734 RepID=A0ABX0XE52_9BACT|nr:deoxyribose-phosphate aldolase [Neolewinella antarctica]NJC27526.1 deoxyribose-phosphate aldolase [Neolewinella antarctica]
MKDLIDHTYLAADCTGDDVDRVCREAIEHGFYAVCIPPYFVTRAHKLLNDTAVVLATVISFPYGYQETAVKVQEIRRAMDEGADELDIVVNISAVKSGDWAYVRSDLESVTTTARLKGKVCKIIVEAGTLSETELQQICGICNDVKPTYVKTSTGTREGASVAQVQYLRANLHADIKIKASGGIRDKAFANALVEAGADRLGTSSGIALVD